MWQNTMYREIARRTGYPVEEVKHLLSIFFGKHGIYKAIKGGNVVMIKNFMSIYYSRRKLYLREMKRKSAKTRYRTYMRNYMRKYSKKVKKSK